MLNLSPSTLVSRRLVRGSAQNQLEEELELIDNAKGTILTSQVHPHLTCPKHSCLILRLVPKRITLELCIWTTMAIPLFIDLLSSP